MMTSVRQRAGYLGGLAFVIMFLAGAAPAEVGQAIVIQADSSLEIVELGAFVESSGDGLRVHRVIPAANRLEKYRQVDIKTGDRLVTVSGQQVGTLDDLQRILVGAKPGDTIKLGMIRHDGPVVAVYTVATETELKAARESASLPVTDVLVEGDGPAHGRMMVKIEAEENSVPWPELAVILSDVDGKIVVTQMLPMPPDFPIPAKLAEGDIISALQSQSVTTAMDLVERYNQCKVGDSIALTIKGKDQSSTLSFVKPKGPGGIIRIRK